MRRLLYLLILVLFVSVSATCVNASTDCERWFKVYREQLAHTRQLQRVAAAKRRAKLYAQRKLAGYVAKPKPKTVVKPGPHMTRQQALHHFDLACGALPEDELEAPLIAEEKPQPPFESHPLDDRLDIVDAGADQMIAENDPPPFGGQGFSPDSPSGGYPNYGPPVGGGGPRGGGGGGTPSLQTQPPPNSPGNPPDTPAPPPDTPQVPEPGSFVLVLTGVAGAAGALRRKFTAREIL
jgi:PEP-CTERM motif